MTLSKELDANAPERPKLPNLIGVARMVIRGLVAGRAQVGAIREQVRMDASRPARVRRLIHSNDK
jgi:hypothetical protein